MSNNAFSRFYTVSEQYWREQPATTNGMLGGYDFISDIDIEQSQRFLENYLKVFAFTFIFTFNF